MSASAPHATLQDEARAARAAGQPGRAVEAWRALLDATPDDWTLALELKQDLEAGLHQPDSCPRFRRAARALPDRDWLDHYATRAMLPGAELAAIRCRALALRKAAPPEARVEALLGQAARQSRRWPEAARAFARAAQMDPAHETWPRHAAEARLYARIDARMAVLCRTGARHAGEFVALNLDRNPERMADLLRQCTSFAHQPRRIAGIEGIRLPAAAVERLTGSAAAPRGTLGCLLSHALAWEDLLSGPHPFALIVEDDAIPLLDLGPAVSAVLAGAPAGWDIIWVNERMQPACEPEAATGFSLHPFADVLAGFAPGRDAVGTDGYLISRAGARALLDWTERDGFAGNVDWRMAAYVLSGPERAAFSADGTVRLTIDREAPPPLRPERLTAYALYPALVREIPLQSDRQDADRALCFDGIPSDARMRPPSP